MSRTKRSEPSSGCWMRHPRGKKSERKRIQRINEEYRDEGITAHKQRKALPPDAWDDLQISYTRGQPWQRVVKSRWQKR